MGILKIVKVHLEEEWIGEVLIKYEIIKTMANTNTQMNSKEWRRIIDEGLSKTSPQDSSFFRSWGASITLLDQNKCKYNINHVYRWAIITMQNINKSRV